MILQVVINIITEIVKALLNITMLVFPQINLRGANGTNACKNTNDNNTSK